MNDIIVSSFVFKPKMGSVYHTGDFKFAASKANIAINPRFENEDWDAYKARLDNTDFWRIFEPLNHTLMHARDTEMRAKLDEVRALKEQYAPYAESNDESRYIMLMLSTFIDRGEAILRQRQVDRETKRRRQVQGMFSVASRMHD